jgi:hypothetical protein
MHIAERSDSFLPVVDGVGRQKWKNVTKPSSPEANKKDCLTARSFEDHF